MKAQINILIQMLICALSVNFTYCSGDKSIHKKSEFYLYSGTKYEKLLIRDFINDSVFIDRLYEDYEKLISADTFKRINTAWYYKDGEGFCEFFSEESFKKREIKRKHYDCTHNDNKGYDISIETYKPMKMEMTNGQKIYVYQKLFTSANDKVSAECYCCHVHFNPLIGFVYMEDESCKGFNIKRIDAVPKRWKIKE